MRSDGDLQQDNPKNTRSEYYMPWPDVDGMPQQKTDPSGTPYDQHRMTIPPVDMPPQQHRERPRRKNRVLYGIVAAVAVVLLILAGCYAFSTKLTLLAPVKSAPVKPTSAASQTSKVVFNSATCPFTPGPGITVGKDVQCGFLTVPEDRSRLGGQTIQLAVATFKGAGVQDAAGPMLYLAGGPGGASLSDLGGNIDASNLSAITLGHDLILLDQRGTGYSKPSLDCQEITKLQLSTLNENFTREKSIDLSLQAMRQCHDRLIKSGINLNAYTTMDNATDVHDLIHALGYKQINLYGVSYGTRLALTVMRLFPGDLRSVVLDSTVPEQTNLFLTSAAVTQHAFNVLFQGCVASPTCNSKYPNLESTFYKLVTDLNAKPVNFNDAKYGPILLNGDGLTDWLFTSMYITQLIPMLPLVIMQISKGDYTFLSQFYGLIMLQGGISYGMYYSVECGEDAAFTNLQALEQSANVLHPEIKPDMLAGFQRDVAVCQMWGQKPVSDAQKQPVVSSLPTLILSGEYDPITPLSNAKQAMETLSNSFLFTFPATGHAVFLTNTCPNEIMIAFLQSPVQKPSGSCIATLHEPDFL